eukprot:7098109-Alexandrium_andersonii.AAC.1
MHPSYVARNCFVPSGSWVCAPAFCMEGAVGSPTRPTSVLCWPPPDVTLRTQWLGSCSGKQR